jgi:hypothetical protein
MLSEHSPMLLERSPGTAGPTVMLPTRLPPELHERLRRWSIEQRFSMAGVVRGLVERFLDEQEGKAAARTARARTSPGSGATKRRPKPKPRARG